MRLQASKAGGTHRRQAGWPSLWGTAAAAAALIPAPETAIL